VYIAGAAEDAHLETNPSRGYEFDLMTKSLRWSEILRQKIVGESYSVKRTRKREYHRIRTWNKAFVVRVSKIQRHPEVVLRMPRSAQIMWARGFIDAEGSVTMNGGGQPMISIYNEQPRKLRIIESILRESGVCVHYYKHKDRDVWQQYITGRKNLVRFLKKIGLDHSDKREKLTTMLVF